MKSSLVFLGSASLQPLGLLGWIERKCLITTEDTHQTLATAQTVKGMLLTTWLLVTHILQNAKALQNFITVRQFNSSVKSQRLYPQA
jgi:BioD-like phosphotransacetylase family protein